ncbi:helix-turn-helix domain-containing protein [Larkinella terrae]|uniref:Helix-turn-helix domain-containing protein n=1 Tax=Larkinella terrae TaxID=2025311 RepID=A0A7K0EHA7_9BACT|nr:helix-turn-helix transcriptional regulator [Larkinella terrae]MRS61239.1 helix-turn-helix domain-containing protein [Larkinella terrae]
MEATHYQEIYQVVGSKISEIRREKKMSQLDLAAIVGLSRASIVNIEKGRQHPPLHLVWQLSDALDVDLFDLLPTKYEMMGRPVSNLLNKVDVAGSKESANKLAEFINIHYNLNNDKS